MPDHLAMPDHPDKALKEKGALAEGLAEPPIPEGIPDEVKKKLLKPKVPTRGRP